MASPFRLRPQIQSNPSATPLPVIENSISSVINQDIASVAISQTFFNDGEEPIEVEYLFPFYRDQVIEAQARILRKPRALL
mmetsp:Transcript_26092/g.46351  ORF Transcript_26092/g.46351 Transcript_26092/m.46351 type:complete len:81 (+) Transcript_26092:1267-1509(+)